MARSILKANLALFLLAMVKQILKIFMEYDAKIFIFDAVC